LNISGDRGHGHARDCDHGRGRGHDRDCDASPSSVAGLLLTSVCSRDGDPCGTPLPTGCNRRSHWSPSDDSRGNKDRSNGE